MKYKRRVSKKSNGGKSLPIQTTIMDILRALSDFTKDDTVVLSAFKSIFDSHNVRLAHSLAPVRLIDSVAAGGASPRATNLGKKQSTWTQR